MPYGWIDDGHYRHRKLAELDERLRKGCVALFWLAISWCNDQLTDGRVPTGAVRLLGGDSAEADELVRVRLWERDGKGYRVHDFLDFNKSRDQVAADRASRHDLAVAGGTARAAQANRIGGRFASGPAGPLAGPLVGDAVGAWVGETTSRSASRGPAPVPGTRSPYPSPEKVPAQTREAWNDGVPEVVRVAWYERGFKLPPTPDQQGAIIAKPSTWDVAAELIRSAPTRAKAAVVVRYVLDGLTASIDAERQREADSTASKKDGRRRGDGLTKITEGDLMSIDGAAR
jgi:hypothetical protein